MKRNDELWCTLTAATKLMNDRGRPLQVLSPSEVPRSGQLPNVHQTHLQLNQLSCKSQPDVRVLGGPVDGQPRPAKSQAPVARTRRQRLKKTQHLLGHLLALTLFPASATASSELGSMQQKNVDRRCAAFLVQTASCEPIQRHLQWPMAGSELYEIRVCFSYVLPFPENMSPHRVRSGLPVTGGEFGSGRLNCEGSSPIQQGRRISPESPRPPDP